MTTRWFKLPLYIGRPSPWVSLVYLSLSKQFPSSGHQAHVLTKAEYTQLPKSFQADTFSFTQLSPHFTGLRATVGHVTGRTKLEPVVPPPQKASPKEFLKHVNALCRFPRYFGNPEGLNAAADYIKGQWLEMGYKPEQIQEQVFTVDGQDYKNVSLVLGPPDADRVIVGAHYDVFSKHSFEAKPQQGLDAPIDRPGADDNASGVAGLLELSRLLKPYENQLNKRLDVVAFTLEEPPNYDEPSMGSQQHAIAAAADAKAQSSKILGMICLEMIGYFSDESKSQGYPVPSINELGQIVRGQNRLSEEDKFREIDYSFPNSPLRHLYGDKGDYLALMSTPGSFGWLQMVRNTMSQASSVPIKTLTTPGFLDLQLSDHRNYLKLGIPSVMVTDTAFYRNHNYHTADDTPESLDPVRAAHGVDGLIRTMVYLTVS